MNPLLDKLQPYPFARLRELFSATTPCETEEPINLGIGEPRHKTPPLIEQALVNHFSGLSHYPATVGQVALREAICQWIARRYTIQAPNINQVLPTLGSREALFSFAQAVLDPAEHGYVICPNPFYQIYEGASYLAGATPYFVNADEQDHFICHYEDVQENILKQTKMVYVCSPANPTGAVMNLEQWKKLFELSDTYGFIIASDECYSEIYFDTPPLGGMQAARLLGRDDTRLIMFSSLSKRSNVPGMRSGFVAGDPKIIEKFLLYRTYHGSAMSDVVQAASITAWNDEKHVIENREKYKAKFKQVLPLLQQALPVSMPDASFYLWADVRQATAMSDTQFAQTLYHKHNVTVLPGTYLARQAHGINPGADRIRIALVAEQDQCMQAISRIVSFVSELNRHK